MRHLLRFTIIGLLWLVGCGHSQVDIPEEAQLVRMARLDLTERLDIDEENIKATEFPEASLGVPEPGLCSGHYTRHHRARRGNARVPRCRRSRHLCARGTKRVVSLRQKS